MGKSAIDKLKETIKENEKLLKELLSKKTLIRR